MIPSIKESPCSIAGNSTDSEGDCLIETFSGESIWQILLDLFALGSGMD
jgi:hypothetical protein